MGEVKMNQYNFVLVVCGSHSISDEVKVLSNPRIPEQKCLKSGGFGILSTTYYFTSKINMTSEIKTNGQI